MSIKSEKARKILVNAVDEMDAAVHESNPGQCDIKLVVAKNAVCVAESDARERAIKSLNIILGEISIDVMQGNFKLGIDYRENYLKYYDNER